MSIQISQCVTQYLSPPASGRVYCSLPLGQVFCDRGRPRLQDTDAEIGYWQMGRKKVELIGVLCGIIL